MYRRNLPLGITLVLLSASAMAGAYHIDYDQSGGNPADEWFTPAENPGLIVCESQGTEDKVNPFVTEDTEIVDPTTGNTIAIVPGVGWAHEGEGGLCYASSQDFADCTAVPQPPLPDDYACTYNKTAADGSPNEKDKKPDPQLTWGMIEPKCVPALPCMPPDKNETGVGQDWDARIASNTRSCNGAWGQTFVYKEAIAYWAGTIPNPETGASGHVTFFVNDSGVEGTYDRDKVTTGNPMTVDDETKTAANCTGNGDSWGLIDRGVGKL